MGFPSPCLVKSRMTPVLPDEFRIITGRIRAVVTATGGAHRPVPVEYREGTCPAIVHPVTKRSPDLIGIIPGHTEAFGALKKGNTSHPLGVLSEIYKRISPKNRFCDKYWNVVQGVPRQSVL